MYKNTLYLNNIDSEYKTLCNYEKVCVTLQKNKWGLKMERLRITVLLLIFSGYGSAIAAQESNETKALEQTASVTETTNQITNKTAKAPQSKQYGMVEMVQKIYSIAPLEKENKTLAMNESLSRLYNFLNQANTLQLQEIINGLVAESHIEKSYGSKLSKALNSSQSKHGKRTTTEFNQPNSNNDTNTATSTNSNNRIKQLVISKLVEQYKNNHS